MSKFSVTINGETMEEVYSAAAELAAEKVSKRPPNQTKPDSDAPTTPPKSEAEKTAVDDDEPEIATRNRWLELVDGTMVYVEKGEELPPESERGRNVTKKEYQAWEQGQLSGEDDSEDAFDDEEEDDFGEDESWTTSDVKVIDYETFKQVVRLFGIKNQDRAKALMKKHSKSGSHNIGQYEADVDGRAAIDAELKEGWKNYDKAIAKVTAG